jgi:hypothetical protein
MKDGSFAVRTLLAILTIASASNMAYAHPYVTSSVPRITSSGLSSPLSSMTIKVGAPAVIGPKAGPTSTTVVPTTTNTAAAQISAVLSGDWSSWTGSASGTLTLADMDSLMTNSAITGSQASVLGMIYDQMNNNIRVQPTVSPAFTLQQTQQNVFASNTSSSAAFGSALSAQTYYIKVAEQISSSTNSNGTFNLYGSVKVPQATALSQGAVNNSFFLSSVSAVLNQNPALISKMIAQGTDDSFTVTFPTNSVQPDKETVSLTDTEIAGFNLATNNGCWLAVLGLAENDVLTALSNSTTYQTKLAFTLTAPKAATPLGAVSQQGFQTQAMNLLTGLSYNALKITSSTSVTSVNSLLSKNFGTTTSSKLPMGLGTAAQSLTIVGYTPATQTMTIFNPTTGSTLSLTISAMLAAPKLYSQIVGPTSVVGGSPTITVSDQSLQCAADQSLVDTGDYCAEQADNEVASSL